MYRHDEANSRFFVTLRMRLKRNQQRFPVLSLLLRQNMSSEKCWPSLAYPLTLE